jgi:hypothetical protein
MNTLCEGCGATLDEGQSFCTVCGKPRAAASTAPRAKFCTGCGSPLASGCKFCEKCGRAVAAEPGVSSPSVVSRSPALQVVHSTAPSASSSGNKVLKFVLIAGVLLMLLFLLVTGSCAYLAYRARQRAHEIEQASGKRESRKPSQEQREHRSTGDSLIVEYDLSNCCVSCRCARTTGRSLRRPGQRLGPEIRTHRGRTGGGPGCAHWRHQQSRLRLAAGIRPFLRGFHSTASVA